MNMIGIYRTDCPIHADRNGQTTELSDFGCTDIREINAEIALDEKLKQLEDGTTIVVGRLSCLNVVARQFGHLAAIMMDKGMHFVAIEDGIDTRADKDANFLERLSQLGQMDVAVMKERTQKGLARAKREGNFGGRPKLDEKLVRRIQFLYVNDKLRPFEIAKQTNVSLGSVYKYLKESSLM
ncbi:Site-specific DNA recombinase [Pilibacter termitis]|uniref:Site-specific DNA recombinase n=1 Tax=Pilibacter termitis TaxID=263852 RepID=A0A1T4QUG1_9ENTE|nr:recombinase family protein [Pilibacter termitis]SKA07324.1 Site-specific DNA recombinase [Pilibacter termitis]